MPGLPFDRTIVWGGLLPWSAAEYMEVLAEYDRVLQMPKDDWDHRARLIRLEVRPGEVQVYAVNTMHPINQLAAIFERRYSGTRRAAHCWRWLQIGYFMQHYDKRLRREGWVRPCGEPGMKDIHGALIHALCTLPFTAHRGRGVNRRLTFEYGDVVTRTRQLLVRDTAEHSRLGRRPRRRRGGHR